MDDGHAPIDPTDAPKSHVERLDFIREAMLAGHDMRTPLFQLARELLTEVERLRQPTPPTA